MQTLRLKNGNLTLKDIPLDDTADKDARVKILYAGICATDEELIKGYMNFNGTLGHEFVGVVEECDGMPELIGKRVVGEINNACGYCDTCRNGMPKHCQERDVLGISGRDGVFAEYADIPAWNLHVVPAEVEDKAAVFAEPLAAACQILEQVHLKPSSTVLLIGDGKLAHLIARVLSHALINVEVVGLHEKKIRRMKGYITRGYLNTQPPGQKYPVVIEASGTHKGWNTALNAIQPQGTIILKSTYAGVFKYNPTQLAVDEIQLVGSRCGPFKPALALLKHGLKVTDMIDGEYTLDDFEKAFEQARDHESLKILFKMGAN